MTRIYFYAVVLLIFTPILSMKEELPSGDLSKLICVSPGKEVLKWQKRKPQNVFDYLAQNKSESYNTQLGAYMILSALGESNETESLSNDILHRIGYPNLPKEDWKLLQNLPTGQAIFELNHNREAQRWLMPFMPNKATPLLRLISRDKQTVRELANAFKKQGHCEAKIPVDLFSRVKMLPQSFLIECKDQDGMPLYVAVHRVTFGQKAGYVLNWAAKGAITGAACAATRNVSPFVVGIFQQAVTDESINRFYDTYKTSLVKHGTEVISEYIIAEFNNPNLYNQMKAEQMVNGMDKIPLDELDNYSHAFRAESQITQQYFKETVGKATDVRHAYEQISPEVEKRVLKDGNYITKQAKDIAKKGLGAISENKNMIAQQLSEQNTTTMMGIGSIVGAAAGAVYAGLTVNKPLVNSMPLHAVKGYKPAEKKLIKLDE